MPPPGCPRAHPKGGPTPPHQRGGVGGESPPKGGLGGGGGGRGPERGGPGGGVGQLRPPTGVWGQSPHLNRLGSPNPPLVGSPNPPLWQPQPTASPHWPD